MFKSQFNVALDPTYTYTGINSAINVGRIYTCTISNVSAQIRSDAYRRFSAFNLMQNCAEIAVTQSPPDVIAHVCSQELSLPFRGLSGIQSSGDAQRVSCLFYERRPASAIFDELARIGRFGVWIADSGMLTGRMYQQSATAVVDATIEEPEFLAFGVEEAPLGTSLHGQDVVREVTLQYGYQHWNSEYGLALRAFPGNTAMANSASAAGFGKAETLSTEYILETATASRYLGYEVGRRCQGNLFVEGELDHRHMALELYDVVRLRHRMLVGSEDLFHLIRVRHDYGAGRVSFTAARLTVNG